jgi:predicted nuclease of predicted toxin-antitoxin system
MLNPSIADQLRQRGHDVIAVVETPALRGQPDEVILATAQAEGRIVVTGDRGDFRRLAAAEALTGRPYPSLILASPRRWSRRGDWATGRLVRALDALLSSGETIVGEYWLTSAD